MQGPGMDERLAAIKHEGHRRRSARHRRYAAVAGVAAVVAFAGPLALQDSGPRSQDRAYAARTECQNASDPSCGPARWEPEPSPNQPATAVMEEKGSSIQASVGQPLEIPVAWADPDGTRLASTSACWGDSPCEGLRRPCENRDAYGVWTPPSPSLGRGTVRLGHAYQLPGSYEVTITLLTASWNREGCVPASLGDPYASEATVTTSVSVR